MTKTGRYRRQSRLSAEFTFCGKRERALQPMPARLGTGAALLLLIAFAAPAAARPTSGPTSSANVEISLSVAPKFGLRATTPAIRSTWSGEPGSGGFCMVTNGQPTLLPILLVKSPIGRPQVARAAADGADQLGWCGVTAGELQEVTERSGTDGAPTLLIVHPE